MKKPVRFVQIATMPETAEHLRGVLGLDADGRVWVAWLRDTWFQETPDTLWFKLSEAYEESEEQC